MNSKDIAVVGLAVRLPDASTIDEYWENLSSGRESITRLADEGSGAPNHMHFAAFPRNLEMFDAAFFGITPHEAELLDPQHRFLLECAWEAFENAGYDPISYSGKVGVFAGCALNTYLLCNLMTRPEYLEDSKLFPLILSSNPDFLATRISYKLNLRGPSHTVQSACSTSLVAVHLACRSLQMGECDMALAGGVALNLKLRNGYTYVNASIFSADGTCRAFDADATGTVFGNGAGVVLLKPLDAAIRDGDSVSAVIRGSAVNNDGSLKVGYTAPSMEGQANVIVEALGNADVHPETISYVEAHGTGTPLGDPIEIAALTRAYRCYTERRDFCAIGSVKTNIGHLDAAAGIAGFVKTVLALRHRKIPPTLHFRRPNPQIDFTPTPFYVNTDLVDWTPHAYPRRAAVSAFGVGGTNAHLILEEAPERCRVHGGRPWQLLRVSARTETALATLLLELKSRMKDKTQSEFADIAHTLEVGRRTQEHRRAFVCRDVSDFARQLSEPSGSHTGRARREERTDREVVFLIPGQEALGAEAGRELYEHEEIFRTWVDRCADLLTEDIGQDIRQILYPSGPVGARIEELAHRPEFAQPALFAVEYALARLWMHWGVHPAAILGHGLGEYVAGALSGVFTLENALRLVAARARMIQQLPSVVTLVVYIDQATLQPLLEQYPSVHLTAVNSSGQCVMSGPEAAIATIKLRLTEGGIQFRRSNIQHGFQSSSARLDFEDLRNLCETIPYYPPKIPLASGVSGQWMNVDQATDAAYWADHMSRPILFQKVLDLAAGCHTLFLEIGPGDMLSRLIRRHPDRAARNLEAFPSLDLALSPTESLMYAAGDLWLHGVPVQLKGRSDDERRLRIELPTYPFERSRYWIEAASQAPVNDSLPFQQANGGPARPISGINVRPNLPTFFTEPTGVTEQRLAILWQETLGVTPIGANDNFFDLGGDSLIAIDLVERLNKEFSLRLSPIDLYEKLTIRLLAEFLGSLRSGSGEDGSLIDQHRRSAEAVRATQSTLRSRARGHSSPIP